MYTYGLILKLSPTDPADGDSLPELLAQVAAAVGARYTADGGAVLVINGTLDRVADVIHRIDQLPRVYTATGAAATVTASKVVPLPTDTTDQLHYGYADAINAMLVMRNLVEQHPDTRHLLRRFEPRQIAVV